MSASKIQILDDIQVKQILKRLAYEVYEKNFNEKELVIAGIEGRGSSIAQMLIEQLSTISKIKIHSMDLAINKKNPSEENVQLEDPKLKLKDKCVIVVDDVLNTGKTLIYSLLPFMKSGASSIQTLVLVDRNHKIFPVSADFIGMSLSTTLQEHIEVTIEKKKVNVYLK